MARERSGRGRALTTCGDVEQNPGPTPAMDVDDSSAASSSRPKGRPKPPPKDTRDRNAPSAEDPPNLPVPPPMPGPNPHFEVDLAHGGDIPLASEPQDPAGNTVTIQVRQALGTLICPNPPPLREILLVRVPVIRYLPSCLQADFTAALAGALDRYTADMTDQNLFAVLSLPKLTMRSPLVKGKFCHEHLVGTVRQRLRKFIAGDIHSLLVELQADLDRRSGQGAQTRARKRARIADSDDAIPANSLRRMRVLVGEGASKKAVDVLLSPGSHDPADPQVIARLKTLNPSAPPPNTSSLPGVVDPGLGDEAEDGFWEHIIRDSIQRFPRGSAGGPSGLRPSHLQDALKRRAGSTSLIKALATLTDKWVKGLLPQRQAYYWSGANLTPLAKPDGGVRPVAVGETLRRLAGKALLATAVAKAQVADLQPVQVGVGVRAAAESVAMGVQSIVDALSHTNDWTILKVDLSNAFNSVDRLAFLKAATQYTPAAYNYLKFAYSDKAHCLWGTTSFRAKKGPTKDVP